MAFRDFRDSAGVRWQAWDVIPRLVERRQAARRRAAPLRTVADERRSGMDRRIVTSRRGVLGDGLGRGWLCFESAAEKRRLTPIPDDWTRCPRPQLERYCRDASPVRRPSQPAVPLVPDVPAPEVPLMPQSGAFETPRPLDANAPETPLVSDPLLQPSVEGPEEHVV